jgi:hypothetical protein
MTDILPFPIDSNTRRELTEIAGHAGCERPVQAIRTAIEAGCTESEIRAALSWFAKCDGLPAMFLRQKLTTMQPGDATDKGLPMVTEVAAHVTQEKPATPREARQIANWKFTQATAIVKSMRAAKKSDADIRTTLAAAGLEWP